jgi:malonyl CoA-acyl carrier protein transacylase
LELLSTAAASAGALKVQRLAVSGAFHTPLMAPARSALAQVSVAADNHVGMQQQTASIE